MFSEANLLETRLLVTWPPFPIHNRLLVGHGLWLSLEPDLIQCFSYWCWSKFCIQISSLTDECDAANARADKAEEEVTIRINEKFHPQFEIVVCLQLRLLREKFCLQDKEKDKQIEQLQNDCQNEKDKAVKYEESLKREVGLWYNYNC